MRAGVIYKITSPSFKCYIGQSWYHKCRWSNYMNLRTHGQAKFGNALRKYGPENFKYEAIDFAYTQEEMNIKEIFYISFFDSVKNGYNCKGGGSRGRHSEESIQKMRDTIKIRRKGKQHNWLGKHHSKKTKLKLSEIQKIKMTGFKHSEESKQKQSKSMSLFYANTEWRPPGFLGKKHTKKSIQKMSDNKAKTWTVISPSGERFCVKNLKKFCISNKISYSNLCGVPKGRRKSSNGWKCEVYNNDIILGNQLF